MGGRQYMYQEHRHSKEQRIEHYSGRLVMKLFSSSAFAMRNSRPQSFKRSTSHAGQHKWPHEEVQAKDQSERTALDWLSTSHHNA